MSNSNVTKNMSGGDVNSEGKPYHGKRIISNYNKLLFKTLEHGADKTEKKAHEPEVHHEAKEHIPHGHNNQVCFILIEI